MHLTTLQAKIHEIRNQKVILDFDLAELYEIQTKVLNQSVKRNSKRFPSDFMFQLTSEELQNIRSQIVTAYPINRNSNALPYAFTEQGVAMLSGILNSDIAINVNIAIMRTFILIRKSALIGQEFSEKLNEIELKFNKQFDDVYEALNYLMQKSEKTTIQKERKQIGYK